MATTNPTITTSWAKIVDAGDDFTLGLPHGPQVMIALAVMTTDEAPAIAGMRLQGGADAVNRYIVGPGYVYAKSLTGASVTAWLHTWTPAT